MKRALASFAALVALAAVAAWVLSAPQRIDAAMAAEVSEPGDVAAGRIVFYAGGCDSCHASPGQSDRLKLGGGAPLATPFGVFYPPNISPDVKDGIGDWSATDFANALHAGVGQGGEQLYPAFPYPSYRLVTMKDVRDLFAYLKTLAPVAGKAPESKLDFPSTSAARSASGSSSTWARRRRAGRQERGVATRALSGRGPRPLWRMPLAARLARRRRLEPQASGRTAA